MEGRPPEGITTEEMRIFLAATAGPRRVQIRSFVPWNVSTVTPQVVAKNASAPSLYVEVRHLSGPTLVLIGQGKNLSPENAKQVDLAAEDFIGTVLLMGEEIWVKGTGDAQNETRIQVGQIQV